MSVARNASYNLIGNLVPLAVTILTIPIYLRLIGLDRYGILSICWVLVGYFGFFELGLGPATSQRIAPLQDEPARERSETVWAALYLSSVLGLAGALVLWIVADPVLMSIRGVRSGLSLEVAKAIPWLALLVPLSTTYGVMTGALQGRQQFLQLNLINSAGSILLSIAPLGTAFFISPELPYLLPSLVLARIVIVLVVAVACWRSVPMLRPTLPPARLIISLATFGGWVTVAGILTPLLTSSEKFAIGWLAGAAAVSIYMVPFNLVSRVLVLPASLASALFPKFAVMSEEDVDPIEAKALSSLSAILTPLVIVLIAILMPFFRLWLGHDIAVQSAPIGVILLIGVWFNCCSYIPHSRLQGRGRPDIVAKISFFQIIPYLALLYLAFRWAGVIGVAAAWSARAAIEMFIFFATTGQPRRLITAIWIPALLVIAAGAVILFAPFPNWAKALCLFLLLAIALAFTMSQFGSRLAAAARHVWASIRV